MEFSLDEQEWEKTQGKLGFSISFTDTILEPDLTSKKPIIVITATDMRHFDDETYEAALTDLEPYFAVEALRLYQLSDLLPAQVLIEIGINIAGNILAAGGIAAIGVALKKFLKPKGGQETKFTFKQGDKEVSLQTSDPDLLQETIQRLLPNQQQAKLKASRQKSRSKKKSH